MIFQHSWQAILEGRKTQTRRIVKPGDTVWGAKVHVSYDVVKSLSGRVVYEVGKDYAVQPGRGKKAVARIDILSIRREDVRNISGQDVRAEGFDNRMCFLQTWVSMHDKSKSFYLHDSGLYRYYRSRAYGWQSATEVDIIDMLDHQPAGRYDAWAIEFEVVK